MKILLANVFSWVLKVAYLLFGSIMCSYLSLMDTPEFELGDRMELGCRDKNGQLISSLTEKNTYSLLPPS